jgi:hypothetical protein
MRFSRQIALYSVLTLAGCSSVAPSEIANAHRLIKLTVVNSDDTTMLLPGVELSYIGSDGSIHPLGQTDQFGEISVSKDILKSKSATVVLCCHSLFFCGALRVKEERLLEYDEYLMVLSPIVVR